MRSVSISRRLWVLAAVIGSYLISLTPILLLGWEGRWLVELLLVGLSPLLTISGVAAFVFAGPVLEHPLGWASAASAITLAVSTIAFWAVTGLLWGLLGTPIAIIAPLAFALTVKPLRTKQLQTIRSKSN